MRSFLCLFTVSAALFLTAAENDIVSIAANVIKTCDEQPFFLCLKERALHFIDSHQGDIQFTDGVGLIKTDHNFIGRSLEDIPFSVDPNIRENEVDMMLVDRIARFVGSHTLQLKLPKDSVIEIQRSLEEARRKKKAKRILMPLLLLLKLKAVALLPLALGFLTLLAVKALFVGKMALLFSGLIGLKKLVEGKNTAQNYEVVTYPQHTHSSVYDEHGSHYARSIQGNGLAYEAQIMS